MEKKKEKANPPSAEQVRAFLKEQGWTEKYAATVGGISERTVRNYKKYGCKKYNPWHMWHHYAGLPIPARW
jgi:hypothetical protein